MGSPCRGVRAAEVEASARKRRPAARVAEENEESERRKEAPIEREYKLIGVVGRRQSGSAWPQFIEGFRRRDVLVYIGYLGPDAAPVIE
jgi:hypothetical protein